MELAHGWNTGILLWEPRSLPLIRRIVLLGLTLSTLAIPSRLRERRGLYDFPDQSCPEILFRLLVFGNASSPSRLRSESSSLLGKSINPAQPQKDNATKVLAKVRDTYRSLRSFQVDGDTVVESYNKEMRSEMDFPFRADFASPAKVRIETKNAVMATLVVSDGRTTWAYIPATKTYSKVDLEGSQKPNAAKEYATGSEAFMAASGAAGLGFDVFQSGIADGVKEASILREEELVELEGKKVPCYVVRVSYELTKEETEGLPAVKTYWIDKKDFIVLRESWEFADNSKPASSMEN
jgi:outer membrane lipoprotein-sorting protein